MVSVSCQFATKMGVIVWYQANIDYISEVLCINKEVPEKKCNGKCYLKKQLNKVDNSTNDDQQTPSKKSENNLPEFIAIEYFSINESIYSLVIEHNAAYSNTYQYNHTNTLFHPPPVSC